LNGVYIIIGNIAFGVCKNLGEFLEKVFSFYQTKDQKVIISWYGKQVIILSGKNAQKFLTRIKDASNGDAQMIMAKVTGNFKRGNERQRK